MTDELVDIKRRGRIKNKNLRIFLTVKENEKNINNEMWKL